MTQGLDTGGGQVQEWGEHPAAQTGPQGETRPWVHEAQIAASLDRLAKRDSVVSDS